MKLKTVVLAAVLLISQSSFVFADPLEDGKAAARKGNNVEALRLYKISAAGGSVEAMQILGYKYETGNGVGRNYAEAIKWYRLGAANGYPVSQESLGALYQQGLGVLQNFVIAHMWYNVAIATGAGDARDIRNELEKKMTPSQIAKAQELAKYCVLSKFQHCE